VSPGLAVLPVKFVAPCVAPCAGGGWFAGGPSSVACAPTWRVYVELPTWIVNVAVSCTTPVATPSLADTGAVVPLSVSCALPPTGTNATKS